MTEETLTLRLVDDMDSIDDTTPAAPWFLARSCSHYLTNDDQAGAGALAPMIVAYARALADGHEAEAQWAMIASMLR